MVNSSGLMLYIHVKILESGKMLLVRIVENNKIDAYFRAG